MTRKQWYNKHKKCPDCGNTQIRRNIGVVLVPNEDKFEDTVSLAHCSACRWRGKVKELKE